MSKDIYPFQTINKEELLTMIYDVLKSPRPILFTQMHAENFFFLKHSCIK